MNIYALSSGRGPSGIAIIRVSGKDALKISERITCNQNLKPKEANLCKFYNPSNKNLIEGIKQNHLEQKKTRQTLKICIP